MPLIANYTTAMVSDVLVIAVVIVAVLLNLLIVAVILSKGKDITYIDLIIVSLTISDILQAGVGYMIEIIYLMKRSSSPLPPQSVVSTASVPAALQTIPSTKSSESECKIAGFSVTFLALTSIFHLTGISIERRFILLHPLRARLWIGRKRYAIYVVLPSWFCGLFWASCPLLGWSSYVMEYRDVHPCSINISDRDVNHLTYSYNLMFWCYVVPVFIMGYCCYDIRISLKRSQLERANMGIVGEAMSLRRKMERRMTLMTITMMLAFLCAWTPYAICLLVITLEVKVPPGFFAFAAVFAKLSTCYNPVIYIAFIKDFRAKLRNIFLPGPRNIVAPRQHISTNTAVQFNQSGG